MLAEHLRGMLVFACFLSFCRNLAPRSWQTKHLPNSPTVFLNRKAVSRIILPPKFNIPVRISYVTIVNGERNCLSKSSLKLVHSACQFSVQFREHSIYSNESGLKKHILLSFSCLLWLFEAGSLVAQAGLKLETSPCIVL